MKVTMGHTSQGDNCKYFWQNFEIVENCASEGMSGLLPYLVCMGSQLSHRSHLTLKGHWGLPCVTLDSRALYVFLIEFLISWKLRISGYGWPHIISGMHVVTAVPWVTFDLEGSLKLTMGHTSPEGTECIFDWIFNLLKIANQRLWVNPYQIWYA